MKQEEMQMHGSMFLLLKKFVTVKYSADAWSKIAGQVKLSTDNYDPHENYPISECNAILKAASGLTGLSEEQLKEDFGEFLVPDLMRHYGSYLKPYWKTFELIQNTEMVMHRAVRVEESKANPPMLNVSRVHDKLIVIDYYSKRKMASLGIGIIKGIAKYYNEADKVRVLPMTEPQDERVQIRIEFT